MSAFGDETDVGSAAEMSASDPTRTSPTSTFKDPDCNRPNPEWGLEKARKNLLRERDNAISLISLNRSSNGAALSCVMGSHSVASTLCQSYLPTPWTSRNS